MTDIGIQVNEIPMADVELAGFTPSTQAWLNDIIEGAWGHPPGSPARPATIPLTSAATLYFLLRVVDDINFPGGKWATIQHLESLIEEATR